MAHLELRNLTKKFGTTKAVDHLQLAIAKGEFLSLLGASGCGKTTTLRMIAGFAEPTEGKIFVDGKDITHVPARERNMGMVFQSYALFPTLSVFENICFGLRLRKKANDEIKHKVQELLELGHLDGLADRYPAQLSGGQQQRVALLRALAIEPSVLLLDEPLSNLDAKLRVEIRKEIRRMQSILHITTVYVTHDQEEALAVSDKIAVMNQGLIQQCGSPIEIYRQPGNQFVSDFIGRSNFLTCEIQGHKLAEVRIGNLRTRNPAGTEAASREWCYRSGLSTSAYIANEVSFQAISRGLILDVKFTFETFLGTSFQIETVTEHDEQTITIELPLEERGSRSFSNGDPLVLSIPARHIRMFKETL